MNAMLSNADRVMLRVSAAISLAFAFAALLIACVAWSQSLTTPSIITPDRITVGAPGRQTVITSDGISVEWQDETGATRSTTISSSSVQHETR